MDLSIIIPAHNEESTLSGEPFRESIDWIRGYYSSSEVIVVDDGSSDNTSQKADTVADLVVKQDHLGKAAAVSRGITEARGDFLLWTDADWSVPVTEIPKVLFPLSNDADQVIGSRGWGRKRSPLHRWVGSSIYTLFCQLAFDWNFTDTQCGMKAGHRGKVMDMIKGLQYFTDEQPKGIPGTDALFDVECLLVARQQGQRVESVPVHWQHVRNRSKTNYGPLLRRITRDFVAVNRAYRQGRYD